MSRRASVRTGYVVAVAGNQATAGDAGTSCADVLAAYPPGQAWKRRSGGNGAKGPRMPDWAAATLPEAATARRATWHGRHPESPSSKQFGTALHRRDRG